MTTGRPSTGVEDKDAGGGRGPVGNAGLTASLYIDGKGTTATGQG